MQPENGMKNLRDIGTYLKSSAKFYELKNEKITPIIFCTILFTSFIGVFIPSTAGLEIFAAYNVLNVIIVYLTSTVYMLAYLKELKGEEYDLRQCVGIVSRIAPRIILSYLLYDAVIMAGIVFLIIPGIILYVMFLFNICYIVDKNKGVAEAFKASKIVTSRRRLEIFSIVLIFNVILFLLFSIIMMFFVTSNNNIVLSFVVVFARSLIYLMKQRMTALLYKDLEYSDVPENKDFMER
jgi:hypothetical protein